MTIHTMAVLGESGRQGLAQIRQLWRQDYRVRGVTRRTPAADGPDYEGVQRVSAGLADPDSLSPVFDEGPAEPFAVDMRRRSTGYRFA
jgi:uncharacterized protein YbjT (DUF2867 family)